MKNKKNLTLLYEPYKLEKSFLYKDVILTPYYLGEEYALETKIVYFNNEESFKKFRNLNFIKLKKNKYYRLISKLDKFGIINNFYFFKYLILNSKKIDYLMFFHVNLAKYILMILYKSINSKGKIYIKLDIDLPEIERSNSEIKIKRIFFSKILQKIDIISCETMRCYEKIKAENFHKVNILNKLFYVPNGFDEEYLKENNIKIKSFEEKENVMITVGRIGTEQKNNEMLLESLNNIDLKDWKIYIIGPYTNEFKVKYDEFIKNNSDKKDSVILTGNVDDKNLLYGYYNRAKVFLLTSRWGSFEIVLSESLRFGDYIVTTDVGTAREITDNGNIGVVTEIENTTQFRTEILKVINNEINLKEKYDKSLELSKKQFLWNEIVKDKKFKEFFRKECKENIKKYEKE